LRSALARKSRSACGLIHKANKDNSENQFCRDYAEARPFHDALVAANPANLVWGTDWPHPRPEGPTPDAADLVRILLEWTPADRNRQAILVDNPAALRFTAALRSGTSGVPPFPNLTAAGCRSV
jgi:predicted TIM-barrel fold metal-dependent hydrolase